MKCFPQNEKQTGLNNQKKVIICLLMFLPLTLSLEPAATADSELLKNKFEIGIGLGGFYKGLISVPAAQWTGSSAAFDLSLQRESVRTSHNLSLNFGRAGSIIRGGRRWPGNNSFSWLPLQYSLTRYSSGNAFGLERLNWGFGATIQWIKLREEIELQTGHRTSHNDDLIGLGLHTGFRWKSREPGRWRALTNISISVAIPPLNRSVVRSELGPDYSGGAFWGALGFVLSLERSFARRWSLGLLYQRQALFLLRTLEKRLDMAELYSAANLLITHLALQIGYKW